MIRKTRIPALACTCEALLADGTPCLHQWYSVSSRIPEACPNRECRSREWNGVKKRVVKPKVKIELPKPIKVRGGDQDEF